MSTSGKRVLFLDPAKIEAALEIAASVAKAEQLRVALVGGVALQLYGSDRFTADVDIAADRYPTKVTTEGVLSFGGIMTRLADVPVDFIVRDDHYADLYDAAVDHARRVPGVPLPVATLPYLGAMKMAAGRGKDLQDLGFILTRSGVNYKTLRNVVVEHLGPYAGDELDALRATAKLEVEAETRRPPPKTSTRRTTPKAPTRQRTPKKRKS